MWGCLKFTYEVPNRPHWSRSLWTRLDRAKPMPVMPNHHV